MAPKSKPLTLSGCEQARSSILPENGLGESIVRRVVILQIGNTVRIKARRCGPVSRDKIRDLYENSVSSVLHLSTGSR